jgi:hypothetical protein
VVLVQAELGWIFEDFQVQDPTAGLTPRPRWKLLRLHGGNDKKRFAALGPPWVRRDRSLLIASSCGPLTRNAA